MIGKDDGIRVQSRVHRVSHGYGSLCYHLRCRINSVDGRMSLLMIEIFLSTDSLPATWACVSRNFILPFVSIE